MVFMNFENNTAAGVISINQLAAEIQSENVKKLTIDENTITVLLNNEQEKKATKESGLTLVDQLLKYGVTSDQLNAQKIEVEVKPPSPGKYFSPA